MIGSRGPQILQTAGLLAGLLLAVGFGPLGTLPSSGATELLATPSAERISPLLVIAAGSGSRPDASSDLVWLVQRGAVSGEQRTALAAFPLGFVLADRGTLVIFDGNGTRVTELGPGRATLLPAGERGSFGSANGDLALYVQIALVPVTAVPDTLPRGMLASEAFPAPIGDSLSLELVRGILNPTHAAELPAGTMPALLLATDSAIELETTSGDVIDIPYGEMVLLTEPASVRTPGHQPTTFLMARSALAESATIHSTAQAALDPTLVDAWHRYGCHLKCRGTLPDGTSCYGGTCQSGRCVATSPGPPGPAGPTCSDAIRNGGETDIDCGGDTCPRCVNGKNCVRRSDCASAFCSTFGACVACTTDAECKANGAQCFCEPPPGGGTKNCYNSFPVEGTQGCASCPPGTVCHFSGTPGAACYQLCSAP